MKPEKIFTPDSCKLTAEQIVQNVLLDWVYFQISELEGRCPITEEELELLSDGVPKEVTKFILKELTDSQLQEYMNPWFTIRETNDNEGEFEFHINTGDSWFKSHIVMRLIKKHI